MNLPDIILSVLVIAFLTVIIFISVVKNLPGFRKIAQWIIISTGFIFHFAVLYGVFYFMVNGINPKGFIPVLTIILLFILPITAVISVIGLNRIKTFILNFAK